MRLVTWLILLLGIILLCTAVFPAVLPPLLRPDLFAILLIFLALRGRRDLLLQTCWLIGLLKDIVSGTHLGAYALIYLLAALAILRLRRLLNTRTARARVLLGFAVPFAAEILLLAPAFIHRPPLFISAALKTLISSALVTAGLTPFAIVLLDRMRHPLGLHKRVVFGLR